jgi:F420-dependent oxidoreductase-like protein
MKFGLQINQFTWPGGAGQIGPTLGRVARTADDAGFDSIWVMDHFFQIRGLGPPEAPMLEGTTALGFLAAHTERARLGLMVGGVHYRAPGLWIKATTTLDVLSGGRAWFGIGAAWNELESKGLGFAFPPLRERFELLEDTLRLAHEMWSGGSGTHGRFDGHHTIATHVINSPQSLSRPRVPILVGGGGERKTLRLAARYADASNLFGRDIDTFRRKVGVLHAHLDDIGRPRAEVEITALAPSIDWDSQSADEIVDHYARLAEAGAQHLIFAVRGLADTSRLERVAAEVMPQLRSVATP